MIKKLNMRTKCLRRLVGYLWITVQQYGSGESGSYEDDDSIRVEHQYRSP